MLVLLPWLQVIGVYAWIPLALLEGALLRPRRAGHAAPCCRLPGWPVWAAAAGCCVEALRGVVPFGGFPWGRLAFATEDTPVAAGVRLRRRAGRHVPGRPARHDPGLGACCGVRRTPVRAVAGVGGRGASWPASPRSCRATPAHRGDRRRSRSAAVQGNVPGEGLEAFAERRAVLDNHVDATLELAARVDAGDAPRPDLVVWPENSSDIDPYADPSAARRDRRGGARRSARRC